MIKSCMKPNVVSIQSTASIRDAAFLMTKHHVGFLPVVDLDKRLIGMIGLHEMLTLEMPAFFNLISDLDFVSDFGAVETNHPTPDQIDQPVTTLMQPAKVVNADSGLLLVYGLMLKNNLSDLPVVSENGILVGIVSRTDIGTTILDGWKEIEDVNP